MQLVTLESVMHAVKTLEANGERASVRKIIDFLGGGSPNTVLKLLNEVKSGAISFKRTIQISDGLIATLCAEINKHIEAATEEAAKQEEIAQDTLAIVSEQAAEAELRLAEALQRINALESVISAREAEIAEQVEKLNAKALQRTEALKTCELALIAERERNDALIAENSALKTQIDALKAKDNQQTSEIEKLRAMEKAKIIAETRLEGAEKALQSALDQLAEAKTEAKEARSDAREAQKAMHKAEKAEERAKSQLEQLQIQKNEKATIENEKDVLTGNLFP